MEGNKTSYSLCALQIRCSSSVTVARHKEEFNLKIVTSVGVGMTRRTESGMPLLQSEEASKIVAPVGKAEHGGCRGLGEAMKISNHFSTDIKCAVQVKTATPFATTLKIVWR